MTNQEENKNIMDNGTFELPGSGQTQSGDTPDKTELPEKIDIETGKSMKSGASPFEKQQTFTSVEDEKKAESIIQEEIVAEGKKGTRELSKNLKTGLMAAGIVGVLVLIAGSYYLGGAEFFKGFLSGFSAPNRQLQQIGTTEVAEETEAGIAAETPDETDADEELPAALEETPSEVLTEEEALAETEIAPTEENAALIEIPGEAATEETTTEAASEETEEAPVSETGVQQGIPVDSYGYIPLTYSLSSANDELILNLKFTDPDETNPDAYTHFVVLQALQPFDVQDIDTQSEALQDMVLYAARRGGDPGSSYNLNIPFTQFENKDTVYIAVIKGVEVGDGELDPLQPLTRYESTKIDIKSFAGQQIQSTVDFLEMNPAATDGIELVFESGDENFDYFGVYLVNESINFDVLSKILPKKVYLTSEYKTYVTYGNQKKIHFEYPISYADILKYACGSNPSCTNPNLYVQIFKVTDDLVDLDTGSEQILVMKIGDIPKPSGTGVQTGTAGETVFDENFMSKFIDWPYVREQWFAPAIEFFATRNILKGEEVENEKRRISPEKTLIKAELFVTLMRIFESYDNSKINYDDYLYNNPNTPPFSKPHIVRAISLGYIDLPDQFNGYLDIDRMYALQKLVLFLGINFESMEVPDLSQTYSDADQLTDTEKKIVKALEGIVTGDDNGRLNPRAQVTRAELYMFLYRAQQKNLIEEYPAN